MPEYFKPDCNYEKKLHVIESDITDFTLTSPNQSIQVMNFFKESPINLRWPELKYIDGKIYALDFYGKKAYYDINTNVWGEYTDDVGIVYKKYKDEYSDSRYIEFVVEGVAYRLNGASGYMFYGGGFNKVFTNNPTYEVGHEGDERYRTDHFRVTASARLGFIEAAVVGSKVFIHGYSSGSYVTRDTIVIDFSSKTSYVLPNSYGICDDGEAFIAYGDNVYGFDSDFNVKIINGLTNSITHFDAGNGGVGIGSAIVVGSLIYLISGGSGSSTKVSIFDPVNNKFIPGFGPIEEVNLYPVYRLGSDGYNISSMAKEPGSTDWQPNWENMSFTDQNSQIKKYIEPLIIPPDTMILYRSEYVNSEKFVYTGDYYYNNKYLARVSSETTLLYFSGVITMSTPSHNGGSSNATVDAETFPAINFTVYGNSFYYDYVAKKFFIDKPDVRYTLDGSFPTASSPKADNYVLSNIPLPFILRYAAFPINEKHIRSSYGYLYKQKKQTPKAPPSCDVSSQITSTGKTVTLTTNETYEYINTSTLTKEILPAKILVGIGYNSVVSANNQYSAPFILNKGCVLTYCSVMLGGASVQKGIFLAEYKKLTVPICDTVSSELPRDTTYKDINITTNETIPIFDDITLTLSNKNVDIYYTTDGTVPTKNSQKLSSSLLQVSIPCVLKAVSYIDGYGVSDVFSLNLTLKPPMDFSSFVYNTKIEAKLLKRPAFVSRTYKTVHDAYCQWISDFSLQSVPLSEEFPAIEIPFSLALLEATISKIGFSNKSGIYIPLSDVPVLSSLKHIDSIVDCDLQTLRSNIPAFVFSKLLNQDGIYASVNCKYAASSKAIMFYIECYKIEGEGVTKEYTYIGASALKLFKNSDTDKGHIEIVFSSKVNPQNSYGLFEFNEDKNTSIVVPDNAQFFPESIEVDKVYSYSTIPTYNFVSSAVAIKDIATGKPILSKPSKISHTYTSALDAYDKWKIVGSFSSASEGSLLSTDDGADSYVFDNNILINPSTVGRISFTSENGLHIYLNPSSSGQPSFTLGGGGCRHYYGLNGSPSLAILFKKPGSDSKSYNGKYRSTPDGFIMFCQFSHYSGSNYRVDVAIKITKGGAIEIVTSAAESGTYLGLLCCNQSTGNYTKSISEANGGFEVALAANTVECYKSEAYKEFVEEPLNKPPVSLTLYNGGEFVISSDGTPNIYFYKNSELNHLKLFFDFVNSESEMYNLFNETFGDIFIDEIENNKTVKLTNGSYAIENFTTVNTRKIYTYRNLDYLKFFKYDLFYVDSNNVQALISQNNSSPKIKFPDLYFKSVGDKKFRIKLFFNEQGLKEYFYEKEFVIKCRDNPTFNLPELNINNSLKFSIGSYEVHLKTYQYGTLLVDKIINTVDSFNISKLFYRKKDSLNPFDSLEVGSEFSFSKILSGSEVIDSVTEFNFNFEHLLEVYEPNSDKLDRLSVESSIDNLVFLPQSYYCCDVNSTYSNSVILDKLPELFTTKLKTTPLFFYFSYVGKIDELKLIDEFRNEIEHLVESKDLLNHIVYFNPLKDRTYYYHHKGFYKIVKYHTLSEPFETEYKISNDTPLEFDTPIYFDKLYSDKTVSLKLVKPDGSVLIKEVDSDVSHVNSLISRIEYYENNGSSVILTKSICPYYQKNSKYIFEKNVEDLFYTAKLVKDYNVPPNSVLSNNKCYAVEDYKLIEVEDGYIVSSLNENIYSYYNPHNKVTYNNKSKVFGYFVPKNTSEKLINLFNKNFKTVGTPIFKK